MCGVKRRPFICFSWLFCLLPSSFLLLIEEKKQKKIKASGTPTNLTGYQREGMGAGPIGALRLFSMYPAKLPRPRQRAFSCLDARKEAKENQGVRDAGQFDRVPKEEGWGPAQLGPFGYSRCTRPNFPALGRGPFLVLMQEKKQKKIKASGTPANLTGYQRRRDGGRPNWGPSAILDVPGQTSPPSAEGLFLS